MQRRPKSSQRRRLIDGMIAVGNRAGYAGASVAAVAAEAGVSKPTFYDYFEDRDECFLAALADVQEDLRQALESALGEAPPERAAQTAVAELVGFATSQPSRARFLMAECLAGGARALEARDRGVAEMAGAIDATAASASEESSAVDIPSQVLVGALCRVLSSRLRRGEPAIPELHEHLLEWVESYVVPIRERRWHSLEPVASSTPRARAEPRLRAPQALGRGRPQISAEEVAHTQRQRIMFAVATLAEEKGFAASTIDDITNLARVDRRAFYSLFPDKQEAFMAMQELGLQEVMAVTAGAYFTKPSWPERIWAAGHALAQFLEANPTIAHVSFIEAYSVGPGAARRVEDSQAAFAIFLQEGNTNSARPAAPSRVVLEAIVKSIFETVYLQARKGEQPSLLDALPYVTFLSLAPFIGTREANAFIDRQTASKRSRSPRSGRTA